MSRVVRHLTALETENFLVGYLPKNRRLRVKQRELLQFIESLPLPEQFCVTVGDLRLALENLRCRRQLTLQEDDEWLHIDWQGW